ncbi:HNH endonuclease signature motif containing protein [Jeotgalibacillus sp. ET6]|uniref:HNH endonuclease n=1 Tax=Jeotgalibacillus sp. ET6 TaxID=3037260 RepID=UPI002418838B|nr:HNH endonuclease signature motif containing protein [Jeotgalibacillus sp. ET6]MDG5470529.1 HNH endonuclease signature motif containing protein [Jeotgalibacillus sp. ET6]
MQEPLKTLKEDNSFEVFINRIATGSINLPPDDLDPEFLERVDLAQPAKEDDDHPAPKGNRAALTRASRYLGKSSVTKRALIKANYLCEYDSSHITFINETSGQNYVEGHHLIPLSFEDNFEHSIDISQNIVALCPNCHRKIHNASFTVKSEMIEKFLSDRIEILKKRSVVVLQEDLIGYYN